MFKAIVSLIVAFIITVLIAAFAFPANAAESVCDSPEWWEKYEGTKWDGAWSVVNGVGKMGVSLSCLYAPYHGALTVVNERKVTQRASVWVTLKEGGAVIATRGDVLVLTLAFGKNSEGQTTLNGPYASGGQPWGNVWLAQKASPTKKYLAVKSAVSLAGLAFEGEWRAYRGDGTFGAGRQAITFDSGGQPEMATFQPDGLPRGTPWQPRLELAGDGVLRLVGGTRVDIFRLRVEGGAVVAEGITKDTKSIKKNEYTQAIIARATATPEQFSRLGNDTITGGDGKDQIK